MYACDVTPGLLARGVEIETRHGLKLEYWASPRCELARLLMRYGETGPSREMLEQLVADAVARADDLTRAMFLWSLCMLEWLAGRLPRALEHAVEAYELGEEIENPHGRLWIGRMKALVEADLGLGREARASAEEGLAHCEATSTEFAAIAATGVLGRIELMHDNIAGAAVYLRGLPGRLLAAGMNDPTWPVWPDAIETIIAAGDLELARSRPRWLGAQFDAARQPAGAGRRWALPRPARGRRGRSGCGLDRLERALERTGRLPIRWRVRAPCCASGRYAGGRCRRRPRARRSSKRSGSSKSLARPCGRRRRVRSFGGSAAGGQVAMSSPRRRSGSPSSRPQAARNKEIAAELFMGLSTVEAHLSHVYRKLGIRSRAGLASRLGPATKPMDRAAPKLGLFRFRALHPEP